MTFNGTLAFILRNKERVIKAIMEHEDFKRVLKDYEDDGNSPWVGDIDYDKLEFVQNDYGDVTINGSEFDTICLMVETDTPGPSEIDEDCCEFFDVIIDGQKLPIIIYID